MNRVGDDLSKNQKHILELINTNNRITATELAAKVQISKRKIEENIAKLKQKGLLQRRGTAKGGSWQL